MDQTNVPATSGTRWPGAVGAAAALVALGAVGYALYLHAGSLLQRAAMLPPVLVAALALVGGAASFFSPCSIAITPGFLAYLAGGTGPAPDSGVRSRRRVGAAGLVALGIITFYGAAGAIVGFVGNVAYNYLIYFIPVVGVAFILLGVLMLLNRGGALAFVERWNPMIRVYARREAGAAAVASALRRRTLITFGFAYGAASHTCALPIFLGILLVPLVAGNYPLAALSVVLYGFAIAFLVVVMMALGQQVFAALRRVGPWLMRTTAVLFIGTGVFLFAYFGRNYGTPFVQAAATSAGTAAPSARFHLSEGADPMGYPYQPRTLEIPTGRSVEVAVTDHVGGCLLRTVFEGLGPGGHAAEVTVPVGATRVVQLLAPHPGRYTFHCGANMFSGWVVAR